MFSEVLIKCRDIRRWGAASLDVCYVACGRFDAYLEAEIKLWDIAGGHVVLTEAGGTGQSFKERIGSKLILPKDYCCGSGESFDELLKIIQGPKGD
jgi:myo-inositol-1(or 4)-monophosphatase